MRKTPPLLILCCAALAFAAAPARAANVSNAKIAATIDKAKAYLYARQKGGNWEVAPTSAYPNDNAHGGGQWGGLTALATYALLAAGESPQNPKLAEAIDFLKKAEIRGTYALALRMQVWLLLPASKETAALMKKDAVFLMNGTQAQGTARGMHDYTPANTTYSHSRSQYAVLGAWAAEQLVPESVPHKYWQTAEESWVAHQDRTGGWTYKAPADTPIPLTPGMTAAGVATLFITQEFLHQDNAADCRGNVRSPQIDAGVAWLAKNFDKVAGDARYERDFPYMTLYAVERDGVAGGLKYFGTHDWFEKGANWIVGKQKADGSFDSGESHSGPIVDTAFATLFLVRGRAPVAIAKVDYTADPKKPANWNQRPRDVANLVRWTGRALERDLNWQVVNLDVEAEDLLDTNILYLAGNQPLALTEAQEGRLKRFVEMGGLVVGHADCSNAPFANSFRKLGEKLFPASEFRNLPPDHVIYNGQFRYAAWKQKPQVQGLSNGARELMLIVPAGDPARLWQVQAVKGREEAWQLMANVFLYANDRKDLRFKGDTHWVTLDAAKKPARKLAVARLQYPGNWDPEPAGWRRMAAIFNNDRGLELQVTPVTVGDGKLAAGNFKVAHLTGTTRFSLGDAAIAELRKFTAGGGLLVVDSAGGNGDFNDAAGAALKKIFPDAPPALLPADHALYKSAGESIPVEYRAHARRAAVGNARTGRLMGVEVGGRIAAVYSREDLSVGLVGQAVDGVNGYAPETATALMINVIESAAPKAAATTKPAAKPTTKPTAKPKATTPKHPVSTPIKK
jgi:hypothetical protein